MMPNITSSPPKFDSHFYENLLKVIHSDHHDPHTLLGLHELANGQKVIRLWRPGAKKVFLEVFGEIVEATKMHEAGIFEYIAPKDIMPNDYRIYHQSSLLAEDPYSFLPTLGEVDQYLFGKGVHYQLYRVLGGRLTVQQGRFRSEIFCLGASGKQCLFSRRFQLLGWTDQSHAQSWQSGVWEIFIPGLKEGEKYKFEIKSQSGEVCLKTDPMGIFKRVKACDSVYCCQCGTLSMDDKEWMSKRIRQKNQPQPMMSMKSIWDHGKERIGSICNYRDLALRACRLIAKRWVLRISSFCLLKSILWMNLGAIRCQDFMPSLAALVPRKIFNGLSTICIKMALE